MALMRRDVETEWPHARDRGLLDWPWRPVEAWRRLVEESQVNVEEYMERGEIVVRAELPGVDPDRDIEVDLVDGNLQIRAERRQEAKIEERDYRCSEIRYGSFTRTLPLPSGTREDDIKASYKDGVLEVRAPVQEETAKPSKIHIDRS